MKGHLRLLFNKTIHVQDRITCIKYTKLLIHLVIKQGITLGCYEPEMTVYFPPISQVGKLRSRGSSEVIHSSQASSGEFRALGSKASSHHCRGQAGDTACQQGVLQATSVIF